MEQEKRYIEEDEITLKELILKVQEYFWEVVRNWKWVVLITIPFVAFFLYKAISTPVTYQAELTFMVNEDDGGGLGGMSAILGQFGIGGGGRGKNNLDKILALAKSQRIIHETLLTKVEVEGKEDYIANHIINFYGPSEEWTNETSDLASLYFRQDSVASFDRATMKTLKSVYQKVIGSAKVTGLLSTGYAESTGIMFLKTTSEKEELSIQLLKVLYDNLSKFYVTKTIEKQQQTFDVMFEKVDSIKEEMTKKEYALANFLDTNRSLLNNRSKLTQMRLKRDIQVLTEAYGASLKNFEIADFSLKNKTPFIQIIDTPFAPLPVVSASMKKNLILGVFLGGIVGLLFVVGRKILRDTME